MNKIKYPYFLIALLFGLSLKSYSQVVRFENLTMADGISSSLVKCIEQDKYGFIWLGTDNGLNIYNGVEFRQIFSDANNSFDFTKNPIENMVLEGDTAWIATQRGLYIMDVITKECKKINLGENYIVRTILLEQSEKKLWIGTNTGLITYNINTHQIRVFDVSNSNISHNIIRSIYKDNQGNLWIGTFDKLNKLSPSSTIFQHVSFGEILPENIKNNLILSIKPIEHDNDSLLWIGMQTGLVLYDRMEDQVVQFIGEESGLENVVVKNIHVESKNNMWLGTDMGLVQLSNGQVAKTHYHNPFNRFSISNSVVWDIFEDQSGTLWFCTDNGVSILSGSMDRFVFYPMVFDLGGEQSGYEIKSIIEDDKGVIWLATQLGFLQYDTEKQEIKSYNDELTLLSDAQSIYKDSRGNIWVATNGGISIYNSNTKKIRNYSADFISGKGLRTNYISSFVEAADGVMLINTNAGLHKATYINGNLIIEFIGGIGIQEFSLGYFWHFHYSNFICTNPETFEEKVLLKNPFGQNKRNFTALLVDSIQNTIWLGHDNGLVFYDVKSEEFQVYEIQSNKNYPLITLLKDDEGNIWASSYSAIIKFTIHNSKFEIYPSGEEISISRFFEKSGYKTEQGDLIFGGQDGFVKFNPQNITKSDYNSPTRFTKLIVANNVINPSTTINGKVIINKEISFTDELVLDYINGSFVVEFSSLHYGSRKGILYKYMLEGEDQDWNFIDNPNGRATYSRLMAGNYTLRVQATNNDGVWNEKEAILKIKIKAPLWASNYFILLYVVVIVLVFGSLFYYYRNRLQWKNQVRLIRLEKTHAETTAKNRQQFFTNVAHEFRTPLNLIIGPLEKLINNKTLDEKGREFAQLIENNARRLLWLNNQFLDLRKVENKTIQLNISEFEIIGFLNSVYLLFKDQAESHNIKYDFIYNEENVTVKLDLRKIETIVFNLLSNAFKFTEENGEICLNVRLHKVDNEERIQIVVKDTGIGMSEEHKSKIFDRFYQVHDKKLKKYGLGIGLNLAKEYVLLHEGDIKVESAPDEGTEFTVILPINEHLIVENSITDTENVKPIIRSKSKKGLKYKIENYTTDTPLILLVEDDREMAEFVELSLSQKYKVELVSNGTEALEAIVKNKPDLIVSDLEMPEMTGTELTKKIKNNPKTADIPLIIISGKSQKECQMAALKEGADAYIVKPFEIELLEIRIENFLKRKEQLKELFKLKNLSEPKEVKVSSQNEKILEKVVASIEKYISDPDLNVEKICDESGFSHTFLYRKIKNMTGQTLKEFIRTVRLGRAEQLLRTKKLSVAEVMDETGFSNHSYFSKCFRKIYKVSPKEYVENH